MCPKQQRSLCIATKVALHRIVLLSSSTRQPLSRSLKRRGIVDNQRTLSFEKPVLQSGDLAPRRIHTCTHHRSRKRDSELSPGKGKQEATSVFSQQRIPSSSIRQEAAHSQLAAHLNSPHHRIRILQLLTICSFLSLSAAPQLWVGCCQRKVHYVFPFLSPLTNHKRPEGYVYQLRRIGTLCSLHSASSASGWIRFGFLFASFGYTFSCLA